MHPSETVLEAVKQILMMNVETGTYNLPADLLVAIDLIEQGRDREVNITMYEAP